MAEPLNIDTLLKRREVYRTYLALKVSEQDWHGVADAANDLRELDAMLCALEMLLQKSWITKPPKTVS